ncbi:MAG: glutamine-hydrolyzing carbamoyl-phosphate synthase small subunit [Candidatus Sericytochromatia bacterium]|nr:glutamine-hydrolyzing carbamoyl-phosphate synthase small subunit [Candidatus Sericytochromatia bacterium]
MKPQPRNSVGVHTKNAQFAGFSWAYPRNIRAEIVIYTGLTGYLEALTDPSYQGQILVFTSPQVGNYLPDLTRMQSPRIQVAGLVVRAYSPPPERPNQVTLAQLLHTAQIPALMGVDTRSLTLALRQDTQTRREVALITAPGAPIENPALPHPAQVAIRAPYLHKGGEKTVVLVDCGVKKQLLDLLLQAGLSVWQVPWDYDWRDLPHQGLLLSNGPGNPAECETTISILKAALNPQIPVLGICLGAQLLGHAVGASTAPLPFGHRGANHPCRDRLSGACYITAMNHGYALVSESLPPEWHLWFEHLHDGSCAGLKHRVFPWRGVQFHPEGCPGPTDTAFILEDFLSEVLDA